jgi:hypothetical protein
MMSLSKASVNLIDELLGYVPTEVLAHDDEILPSGAPYAVDHIILMRVGKNFSASKKITINADGSVDVKPYHCGTYFDPLALPVSDLPTMHVQCVRTCEGKDGVGYLVGGDIAPEAGSSITRAKSYKPASVDAKGRKVGATPRGLVDGHRHWLICDLDKILNHFKIDPRRDPAAALAFLIDLFPKEMQDTGFSWQWSSSTCVIGQDGRPLAEDDYPKTLGAHFRFWLSRSTTEAERKSLLNRLRLHAIARLETLGAKVEIGARVVDPQVGVYNQPVYTARPVFTGMADPFPGDCRYGMINGTGVVDVERLLEELPVTVTMSGRQLTAEQKAARKLVRAAAVSSVREKTPQKWERDPLNIILAPWDGNSPQDAIIERLERLLATSRNIKVNRNIWRARFLLLMPRLVARRMYHDSVWRAAGGVPDGLRNSFLMLVSSAMTYLFDPGRVPDMVRDYCSPLIAGGFDAIESGWAGSCEYAVMRRAVDDADGIVPPDYTVGGNTYKVDAARYGYFKATAIEMLGITEEEMIALGDTSICNEPVRHYLRRRAKGTPTMAQRRENSEENLKPWVALGISRTRYKDNKRLARGNGQPLLDTGNHGDQISVEEMDASGLPLIDTSPLYGRPEMQDLCAITTLSVQPQDVAAFEFIADQFGVSSDAMSLISSEATREAAKVCDVLLRHAEKNHVGPGSKAAMWHLGESLQSLAYAGQTCDEPSRMLRYALNVLGYAPMALMRPDAPRSLRNSLNCATAMAEKFEDIAEFLSQFEAACAEQDEINLNPYRWNSDIFLSGLQKHGVSDRIGLDARWRFAPYFSAGPDQSPGMEDPAIRPSDPEIPDDSGDTDALLDSLEDETPQLEAWEIAAIAAGQDMRVPW